MKLPCVYIHRDQTSGGRLGIVSVGIFLYTADTRTSGRHCISQPQSLSPLESSAVDVFFVHAFEGLEF